MNYDLARAIIVDTAPSLIIDPPGLAGAIVVRKHQSGPPFSISLVSVNPDDYQNIPAQDAVPAVPAVPATDDHPGSPAIPAKPAQPARTVAGQVAQAEKEQLLHAISEALRILPDPVPASE